MTVDGTTLGRMTVDGTIHLNKRQLIKKKDLHLDVSAIKQSLCYCKLEQKLSVRRKFIFLIFCQCQIQGFLVRSLVKAFLGGNKYISCHGYVSLDAYCCHFFAFFIHCSQ